MEQTVQNPQNRPIARLDPAVMNLDPSLSHLDKSGLETTKDNASRCIGDGPAFIDQVKVPGINATAESRKELTGTTADEQGMRLTNPTVGQSNFNAGPQRAYANTGESMFQRSEESGLPHDEQLPTGSSTFGPGGPSQGPAYAYNTPHDLLTTAGPSRPPIGVNDRLEGQEERQTADNSNLVAARGAFNDPTIASGQNLQDPNLRENLQQQPYIQQQQQMDNITTRTHHVDLGDERTPAFMHEILPPNRISEDSEVTGFQQHHHLPRGVTQGHTIPSALKSEILHHKDSDFERHIPHPSIDSSESGISGFQQQGFQQQGFQQSSLLGQQRFNTTSFPESSFQTESSRPLLDSFQSASSLESSNISQDKQVNHPEFSATTTGTGFSGTDSSIRRDIPIQERSAGFQGFQGQDNESRQVVGPAEPFQPGVHSGLRYAEPTEGLPGHSTYRA